VRTGETAPLVSCGVASSYGFAFANVRSAKETALSAGQSLHPNSRIAKDFRRSRSLR